MTAQRFRLKAQRVQLLENDVEKAALDLLRYRGWWPIRLHAGLFRSWDGKRAIHGLEKGTPDYVVVRSPAFFMETKRPGGILSDEQKAMIDRLERFNGLKTIVVEGVEELVAWLDRHNRGP